MQQPLSALRAGLSGELNLIARLASRSTKIMPADTSPSPPFRGEREGPAKREGEVGGGGGGGGAPAATRHVGPPHPYPLPPPAVPWGEREGPAKREGEVGA